MEGEGVVEEGHFLFLFSLGLVLGWVCEKREIVRVRGCDAELM